MKNICRKRKLEEEPVQEQRLFLKMKQIHGKGVNVHKILRLYTLFFSTNSIVISATR